MQKIQRVCEEEKKKASFLGRGGRGGRATAAPMGVRVTEQIISSCGRCVLISFLSLPFKN